MDRSPLRSSGLSGRVDWERVCVLGSAKDDRAPLAARLAGSFAEGTRAYSHAKEVTTEVLIQGDGVEKVVAHLRDTTPQRAVQHRFRGHSKMATATLCRLPWVAPEHQRLRTEPRGLEQKLIRKCTCQTEAIDGISHRYIECQREDRVSSGWAGRF